LYAKFGDHWLLRYRAENRHTDKQRLKPKTRSMVEIGRRMPTKGEKVGCLFVFTARRICNAYA